MACVSGACGEDLQNTASVIRVFLYNHAVRGSHRLASLYLALVMASSCSVGHPHKVRLADYEEHEADDHEAGVSALTSADSHDVLVSHRPASDKDGRIKDREGNDGDDELGPVLPQ